MANDNKYKAQVTFLETRMIYSKFCNGKLVKYFLYSIFNSGLNWVAQFVR